MSQIKRKFIETAGKNFVHKQNSVLWFNSDHIKLIKKTLKIQNLKLFNEYIQKRNVSVELLK